MTSFPRHLRFTGPSFAARFVIASSLLGCFALAGHTAHAQSAAGWNKRGEKAELREDYDLAFEDYKHAWEKSPKDIRYKTRYENMRSKAATAHVDRGRVYLQGGDSGAALTEFTRALAIDPSNQTAQQEIDIIRNPKAAVAVPPPGQLGKQTETQKEIASVTGVVELKPVSNDPITLHMIEDTKMIYQAIGKAAGLNVLFDPDYTSKRIPVDLTNVTLSDALRIVGTISGTFYKPVTSNTIFVAQNTRQKRTDLDEMAVQTFYLTNTSTANDATEVLTAIRNLLDPSVKIFLVATQNAIVMRATPDQLLLAQKLLNDLDRSKPEVVVDVAVLEVNRDRIRQLGIQLPQSFGISAQVNNAAATTTTGTTTTASTTSTSSNFTLNNLAHLNAGNFAVTIGAAEVDALLTDSDTRILQNPRIRASDGQRATLKIGSKIPVATGSYSAGAATGLTAGIGVQTQFTYLDVGVNIDMTPTVHLDREVSLKLKVEVSSQNGSVTISGVTEPIISQRVAEQVIQLADGEPSVLAGILTQQDSLSLSGTPGLGELPLLKYFFGSRRNEKQQDEIVFLLIPHVVRESVLSRLNTRAIDTGTSQSIELRREGGAFISSDPNDAEAGPSAIQPPAPVSAAGAAAAMVHPTPQQMNMNLPGSLPQTTAPIGAGGATTVPGNTAPMIVPPPGTAGVTLTVQPGMLNESVGSTFKADVVISKAQDVFAIPLQLQFNPAVLQLVNVDTGNFLGSDGQAVAMAHRDEGDGLVAVSARRPPNTKGVTGEGTVCTMTFKALAAGDSMLTLVKVGASNSENVNIPVTGSQAMVHVK